MQFGVFLSYGMFVPDRAEATPLYDRMLELAKIADIGGFDYAWTPEHHLIYMLQSPSALIPAVQIAQHTRNLRVGTAVIVLPYREPIQTAGEIAQADNATQGRLEVGVARGAYGYEFKKLKIPFEESRDRFVENLEAIKLLLENEETESSFHGRFVDFNDAYIWPRPQQRPRPRFWMGAQTEPAIEDAARRGYDVLHAAFFWDDDHLARLVTAFERGRKASGNPDLQFGVTKYAYFAADDADADERLDELVLHWRVQQQLHDFSHTENPRGIVLPRVHENELTKDEIRSNVIVGTEDHVRRKLDTYREMGVSLVNLSIGYAPPHDHVRDSLERFAGLIGTGAWR